MRRAHIRQLTIVGPAPIQGLEHLSEAEMLEVLLESVPDPNGWILNLARHFRVTTIGALLMKLRSVGVRKHGESELLTMRLCLMCGPIQGSGSVFPRATTLAEQIQLFVAKHGLLPPPAMLLWPGGQRWLGSQPGLEGGREPAQE